MAMKWRFIDTGVSEAGYNMAMDEAILSSIMKGVSLPAVRLYRWKPAAISLGYSQKASLVLDLEKCTKDNIDVTRRQTGGRAVYHDEELTYSVIGPVDDVYFGGPILDTYKKISGVLCAAIRDIGVDAELSKGSLPSDKKTFHMTPCFVSTAKYEITVGGKKIVGSAQQRVKGCFLQHGSIITGTSHKK